MVDVIKEIVIDDVDPEESDESLWAWLRDDILLRSGIPVDPWMQHTMSRDGTTVTVQLNIPLYQQPPTPLVN